MGGRAPDAQGAVRDLDDEVGPFGVAGHDADGSPPAPPVGATSTGDATPGEAPGLPPAPSRGVLVGMDAQGEVAVLAVPDVRQAVATFRDVLGLEVVEDRGWMAAVGVADGPRVILVAEDAALGPVEAGDPDVIRVA